MNIDITEIITEDEIKAEIIARAKDVVVSAVNRKINTWGIKEEISKQINSIWNETLDQLILDQLKDSDKLKANIRAEIEAKLKRQIAKLMRGDDTK